MGVQCVTRAAVTGMLARWTQLAAAVAHRARSLGHDKRGRDEAIWEGEDWGDWVRLTALKTWRPDRDEPQ